MLWVKKLLKIHWQVFAIFLLYYVISYIIGNCLVKAIIGIPCPGCGLTRATLAALRLDFKAAYHYHPLFWLAVPFLLFVIHGRKPLFNNKTAEIILYGVVGILFVGVYIYRMATLFPNVVPMDYETHSLFNVIFSYLKSLRFIF